MIFQELATISDPPHKEGSRGAFATKRKFDKMLKIAMQRASRMPSAKKNNNNSDKWVVM